ncbi:MAG: methionine aminotransferase [Flavobacteriales bacterium]|nr:methionine aminotransferase [Flavobacteriales bacterium]
MSKMAHDHGAINLSQGFPDFEVDPVLIDLVSQEMRSGNNQYAPLAGVMTLREAIANKTKRLHGVSYNPEREITVTAGATQAIFTAITALVKEEDEVIVFTPAYDCYVSPIILNGGKPVYVQLRGPEFKVDWNDVKKVVTRKTRLIIINSPHNPSGAVWSEDDMRELERLATNSDALVLSDEVYEHIVFDGRKHWSASKFPDLAKRSLIVASFGKTFHVTGWKLGYIMAPENLMEEFRKVHQYLVFCVNAPMQLAIAKYLEEPSRYNGIAKMYEKKRDTFLAQLEGSRFRFQPTEGSYFQLLDYSAISNLDEVKFAEKLTKEFGVASIPVSVFYHKPLEQSCLRFCFAKSDETLSKAGEILREL